ncbi:MAG TPA: GntR family transcriptional regulator [Vicinamibacterales bacterium]|nr:GntR family transcriptional regulator [Vicinamibacterales bacterium]
MALVTIDPKDTVPIYAQIENAVRAAIATGRLKVGDQLPTVRQMAVDLGVNANTIARVYMDLEHMGVIETRRGIGSFVAASRSEARPAADAAKRLRAFVLKVLSDADGLGFTYDDVMRGLEQYKKKGA